MKRFACLLFVSAFLALAPTDAAWAGDAQAGDAQMGGMATPSLFFSPGTVRRIDALVQNKNASASAPRRALRLDGLLYAAPGNWTFWLGGEPWRPGTDRPPLHVIAVTADSVRFALDGKNGKPGKEIVLHPSQTLPEPDGG